MSSSAQAATTTRTTTAAAEVAAAGPATPRNSVVKYNHGTISLSFDDPGATTPAITSYEISLDGGATWTTLNTTASTAGDGTRLRTATAVVTDGYVYRVAVRAVSSAGKGTPTQAWSSAPTDGRSTRLLGPDRIATAIAVSQDTFPDLAGAPAAVLTTSGTYADALAGGALAAKVGGPLLLTTPGHLDDSVARELRRVVKAGGTVYVLGDTGAVTGDVETQLRSTFTVKRLAGKTRFSTALAVADTMRALGAKGPAYLVTGTNFPDGLAVAALAAHKDGLVVLSNDTVMDAATQAWLAKDDPNGTHTVPVGGPAHTAASVLSAATNASAIDGVDRYDTARRVAAAFGAIRTGTTAPWIGMATVRNWPDALVAGAAIAHRGGPLLLTDGASQTLTPATALAIGDLTADGYPAYGMLFGGADVLSDGVMKDLSLRLPAPGA
ncbi:cell wall-binding repeat-containing protein [Quadrisphaera granulorum]|uniref:cell wall-binding repeat-containing protein n=1 Tax=Quadrisphaera granulorum TaxID=317664 RepID=UPI001474BD5C|nr:cell wall-binding repeat-containing protein [Quadrisphaera granulorum]